MLKTIEEAIIGLVDSPQKCLFVQDERLANMGYRKLIVKNYIVFYTICLANRSLLAQKHQPYTSPSLISRRISCITS
jgi:hypothetical protein